MFVTSSPGERLLLSRSRMPPPPSGQFKELLDAAAAALDVSEAAAAAREIEDACTTLDLARTYLGQASQLREQR